MNDYHLMSDVQLELEVLKELGWKVEYIQYPGMDNHYCRFINPNVNEPSFAHFGVGEEAALELSIKLGYHKPYTNSIDHAIELHTHGILQLTYTKSTINIVDLIITIENGTQDKITVEERTLPRAICIAWLNYVRGNKAYAKFIERGLHKKTKERGRL